MHRAVPHVLARARARRFPSPPPLPAAHPRCVSPLLLRARYASYDRFSGALKYARANVTTVPKGDAQYPDKRESGSWYIGIEASPAVTTEFYMDVEVLTDVVVDKGPDCDRFGRYACSNEVWEVPGDLLSAPAPPPPASAAARLTGGGRTGAAWRSAGVSSACACALLGSWAWLRLVRPRPGRGRRRRTGAYTD